MSPIKVGQTLTTKLSVSARQMLLGLPLQIKYDPKVLEIADVTAGEFFTKDGVKVKFSHNDQRGAGLLFITQNRDSKTGISGSGEIIELKLKALKPTEGSLVTVLPTSPIGVGNAASTPTKAALLSVSVSP